MTHRHSHAGESAPQREPAPDFGLFAPVKTFTAPAYDQPIPEPKPQLAAHARALDALTEALVRLTRSALASYETFSVDDIRDVAEAAGLLRTKGLGREYAFLHKIPRLAGAVATGERIRSKRPGGNIVNLYRWAR